MIDLKDLRENPEKYRRGAELKNISVDIDQLLRLESRNRELVSKRQELAAEKNKLSKQVGPDIGKLKTQLKKDEELIAAIQALDLGETEQLKVARQNATRTRDQLGTLQTRPDILKLDEQRLAAEIATLEPEIERILLQIPQPPDSDVPEGKDATQNIIQRKWGEPRKFEFKPKNHIELGEALGLFDTERGVKLAGSRSYFLIGIGAELQNAVLRLAMDMMTREHGFTAMTVPVLVREEAMRGTGFFPAGKEQAYHVQDEIVDNEQRYLYLTGTGEVGLTAFHMDDTLDESDLPKKYTTVSTCFRREAGTYGKDTAGLYRIHQFDKCEQVVICKNDFAESRQWHTTMLGYSEQLLQRLGLPYRVIQCCTGDIGVKNAAMYDLETFMPGRVHNNDPNTGYGETHSASRLYEFQARRLNLRYKDKDGKIRFCHTLNNTVAASPRILIPILENYQNEDGSVTVPEVLRGYMNGRERIAKNF